MRSICLTLPTNRACAPMVTALMREAAYAARNFDVEVHVLVLDSSGPASFAEHASALRYAREAHPAPHVVTHHLGEEEQRDFLRRVIHGAGVAKPELMLDLMLPESVSYGACTNRAFLLAKALGCESVHRRDSDSSYQVFDGELVFPVHHELLSLGKLPHEATDGVTESALGPEHAGKPVALVAGSFVGELSVDIGEIQRLDPEVYYDVVSLWAPVGWPRERKRELVDESFRGAGNEPFTGDRSVLTLVDPMRIDMCNIGFHGVHECVPLPPATETIGSDYFLMHLVRNAGLPGVLHNRNIVNFYTGERRTDPGFLAYQTRFTKFFFSMLYLNFLYDRLAETGTSLLDDAHLVRADRVAELVRESTLLDTAENVERLDILARSYRKLGGRYAEFAASLEPRGPRLLAEARHDMEDFALLTEVWGALMQASTSTTVHRLPR
ncbi:DUF6271 family protein [Streptomyces sp. NPDC048172]|uniref:DUF6271 family protein n=1 Tax=Streptomyces sp. NPDC048172 TaxID=3365505 RepID=UPI00371290F5